MSRSSGKPSPRVARSGRIRLYEPARYLIWRRELQIFFRPLGEEEASAVAAAREPVTLSVSFVFSYANISMRARLRSMRRAFCAGGSNRACCVRRWPRIRNGGLMTAPIYNNALQMIGNTPLMAVKHIDTGPCELFLKLENQNPGGSIKDRVGLYLIEAAERAGKLKPGGTAH